MQAKLFPDKESNHLLKSTRIKETKKARLLDF